MTRAFPVDRRVSAEWSSTGNQLVESTPLRDLASTGYGNLSEEPPWIE
jgi:hypothetical protein